MYGLMFAALLTVLVPTQADDDPVADVVSAITEATDNRLRNWQYRIESGAAEGEEDARPWSEVRLPHVSVREYRVRYRAEVRIPEVFAGSRIDGGGGRAELELQLYGPADISAEIFLDGEPVASVPGDDPVPRNPRVVTLLLSENAQPGETFDVEVFVFNSNIYPPQEFLDVGRNTLLRSALLRLERGEPMRGELEEFAVNLAAADRLLRPWRPPQSEKVFWPEMTNRSRIRVRERRRLRDLLQRAAEGFDLEALRAGDSERLRTSMGEVLGRLGPVSEYAKSFTVYLVGNAHIDLAWLWRKRESVQISANTYRSVLDNMEEYPRLTYAQSQAQSYRWVEENDPGLFRRMQEAAAAGNWDVVGGMWAEPDCNLPSGESWVRQMLYAQRYFAEHFGMQPWLGWNPDSFGYNWNMPQLYSRAGIRAFITQKIHWNDTTIFPYHLFWWEAPDGSRILTYFPTGSYTERVDPLRMVDQLMRFEYNTGFREVLVLFGLGNHGGGPNRPMLERAEMLSRQPLYPRVEFTRAHDFIEQLMEQDLSDLPVWRDELYLEYHRGTYTTQAATKRGNRRCESLLETAEKAAAISALLGGDYPRGRFQRAWELVLLNQFHDILPGSSITPVYHDAAEDFALALRLAKRALRDSLETIASRLDLPDDGRRRLMVFNPLSWQRDGVVRLTLPPDSPEAITVRDTEGTALPSQIVLSEDGLDRELVFIARAVPSLGYKLFILDEESPSALTTDLRAEEFVLENEYLRVEVNRQSGNIVSILDKTTGAEVLAEGQEGNILELHENIPLNWDAWNIGYTGRSWELSTADSVELLESGPARAVIRVSKSFLGFSKANRAPTEGFPSSFFVQDITLYAGVPRLDVTLRADWWEDHTLLKVSFPVAVDAPRATYEIPFGAVTRPTTRSNPWERARFEVPVHRWADVSEGDRGVSLLNDSKYGMDIEGSVMRLTMLTSPLWPDPTADRGRHVTTYSIYPHAGDWRQGQTPRRGRELNLPLVPHLLGRGGSEGGLTTAAGFFSVDAEGVVIASVKLCEDSDDIILRLVETLGEDAEVTVALPREATAAVEVDLLEQEIGPLRLEGDRLLLQIGASEIRSIKVSF